MEQAQDPKPLQPQSLQRQAPLCLSKRSSKGESLGPQLPKKQLPSSQRWTLSLSLQRLSRGGQLNPQSVGGQQRSWMGRPSRIRCLRRKRLNRSFNGIRIVNSSKSNQSQPRSQSMRARSRAPLSLGCRSRSLLTFSFILHLRETQRAIIQPLTQASPLFLRDPRPRLLSLRKRSNGRLGLRDRATPAQASPRLWAARASFSFLCEATLAAPISPKTISRTLLNRRLLRTLTEKRYLSPRLKSQNPSSLTSPPQQREISSFRSPRNTSRD